MVLVEPEEKSRSHRDQIPTTYMYLATLSRRAVSELMAAMAEVAGREVVPVEPAARAATAESAVL